MCFSPSLVDVPLPLSLFTTNTYAYTRTEQTSTSLSTKPKASPQLRPIPPLHSAAFHLEKLLLQDEFYRQRRWTDYRSKPSDIVKGWLVNSAGVGGLATLADIHIATVTLLDPNDKMIVSERDLLLLTTNHLSAEGGGGKILTERNNNLPKEPTPSTKHSFLKKSSREIGSWLLSLTVNLLWKEAKYTHALNLCSKAFSVTNAHINYEEKDPNADSLNPLLGRLGWCLSVMASRCVKSADETLKTSNARMDVFRKDKAAREMIVDLMLSEQQIPRVQQHSTRATQRQGSARYLYPHLNYHPFSL
eukprot:CAMPEP_0198249816 /NCGR_PEP_ID=MMETSP1447-20131203/1210_1 /TAXON_ID=420782 /ORGANISM="Chaetoceros dichaeta, Strain CCMP1751" /LENGTH=303 /DNA_ID=CAMNT_0043934529 /DNA_START=48 /DNA_END=959 /DNA_ORIENTATION=-